MSKFTCKCGYTINLSQGWSDCELALLPESKIEEIGDMLTTENKPTDEKFYELIDEVKITVYRCPNCERIHISDGKNKDKFTSYIQERE
jgi:rubredoxin